MIKFFRWVVVPIAIILLIIWTIFHGLNCCPRVQSGQTAVLYASQTQDNLHAAFSHAIEKAEHSIFLVIYSFSDEELLSSLQRKADEGVAVTVVHDITSSQRGFRKLHEPIEMRPVKCSGLMHQKILVIDEMEVWIGSANFTTESLRVHENLVIGVYSPELAETIIAKHQKHEFSVSDQSIEFWEATPESLERLIALIDGAHTMIRVGMFAWTHPKITDAIVRAKQRGLDVEVVLDPQMAQHVSRKSAEQLVKEDVPVRLHQGIGVFHHKFAWIDESLINGSTNWTRSAFTRNHDCFLILHELTEEQTKKMQELWHVIKSTSKSLDKQHFVVFWQRPECIVNELFEAIPMAA